MSARLFNICHDKSLLISLVENLAQHVVEIAKPVQRKYYQEHRITVPVNGLGEVNLFYRKKPEEESFPGYEQFEALVKNRRVLFLRGKTLQRAAIFDADSLDSRTRLMLERYVQQNFG